MHIAYIHALIKLDALILCPFKIVLYNYVKLPAYSRFQITFQSAVAKFVLNIPNYTTKGAFHLCGQIGQSGQNGPDSVLIHIFRWEHSL